MKIANIHFSPTGGTKHVADTMTTHLSDDILEVDLCKPLDIPSTVEADLAIISVPVYNGRVSGAILKRISRISVKNIPCVIIAVYGNRAYENALAELSATVGERGFKVIAGVAAVAQHSMMPQYGQGRPNADDKEQLKQFAEEIKSKLEKKDFSLPSIPGIVPTKPSKSGGLVPKPGKICDRCGLCAVNCPMQAINSYYTEKVNKKRCISCMRCVVDCPLHTRHANRFLINSIALLMRSKFATPKTNNLFI